MITKERFAVVVNQEFSVVLHETFQLFPSLGRDLFPSLDHVRTGKLFHSAGRLLIFLHHQEWKYQSQKSKNACSLTDETSDRGEKGEIQEHERVHDTNLCERMGRDIHCSIHALVKNREVIYSLTLWAAAQLIPRRSVNRGWLFLCVLCNLLRKEILRKEIHKIKGEEACFY